MNIKKRFQERERIHTCKRMLSDSDLTHVVMYGSRKGEVIEKNKNGPRLTPGSDSYVTKEGESPVLIKKLNGKK